MFSNLWTVCWEEPHSLLEPAELSRKCVVELFSHILFSTQSAIERSLDVFVLTRVRFYVALSTLGCKFFHDENTHRGGFLSLPLNELPCYFDYVLKSVENFDSVLKKLLYFKSLDSVTFVYKTPQDEYSSSSPWSSTPDDFVGGSNSLVSYFESILRYP